MQHRRETARILLLEDDDCDAELVVRALHSFKLCRYDVEHVTTMQEGVAALEEAEYDAILLDMRLPDAEELDGLRRVQEAQPGVAVIVCTGLDDHDLALRAVQEGAQDYLIKNHLDRVLLARSITYGIERKRSEQLIRDLAYRDPLTGLPNRLLLHDRISQAIESGRRHDAPFALLYLDLDGFKEFNDTLGHAAGDTILSTAAARLEAAVRSVDTVARLGGDEFIVLLGELRAPADAAIVARKVLAALAAPFDLEERRAALSASVGIAVWPEDGTGVDELMRSADAAMYAAKRLGKGRYRFHSRSIEAADATVAEDVQAMSDALERGEFVLHYQPIVDLRKGVATEVEALLRWCGADGTARSPSEFIPAAEKNSMIDPIGEWVAREAVRQSRIWQRAGLGIRRISINLSPHELVGGNVTRVIARLLDKADGDLRLGVDFTESSFLLNERRAMESIRDLFDMGVYIAIDDFGTGSGSLERLRQLPAHALRIDRSFIAALGHDPGARAIVQGIVAIAHGTGKQVIAEGVETAEQLHFLRECDCDKVQGHYFGAAVSAEEVSAMLDGGARPRRSRPAPSVTG